jgi:hypothetical protein
MKKLIISLLVGLFVTPLLYAEGKKEYRLKVVTFTKDTRTGVVIIDKMVDVTQENIFKIRNFSCNAYPGVGIICDAPEINVGTLNKNSLLMLNFKDNSYVVTCFKVSDTNSKGELK